MAQLKQNYDEKKRILNEKIQENELLKEKLKQSKILLKKFENCNGQNYEKSQVVTYRSNINSETQSLISKFNELVGLTKNMENVYRGPRGGVFYINSRGEKTYIKDYINFE